jgi:uncharacterized protein YkwD
VKGVDLLNFLLKNKIYIFILLLFIFSGCGSSSSENLTNTSSIALETENSYGKLSNEQEKTLNQIGTNQHALLEAINKERAQVRTCGDKGTFGPVHPLTWNSRLYASALEHSLDLASSDTFSHDGSGTASDLTGNGTASKFNDRIVQNGYTHYYALGENIAGRQRSVEEVMRAWMASPGHCENIMKNTYTEVGVAIVINEASTYQVYWTQDFGSKRL